MMIVLEALAAVTGLLSVYLVTKQNIWCWPIGLVSVAMAAVVFFDSFLYSDMILHVYFFGMNVYGWIHWSKKPVEGEVLPITTMNFAWNTFWIVVTAGGTILWGYTMSKNTNASFPYGDAFTTVGSLIAQWFMAQKKLENWVYWFVIDIVAISIYALKGLYLFSGQYFIFLVLCVVGYRDWKKAMLD
jgi:nicotinamide mononucleotide transporter